MSKLDELIKKFCSNGVKFTKLENLVLRISSGLNPRQNFKLNEPGASNYYLTVKEISSNKIEFSDKTAKITNEAVNIIQKRSHLEQDDILLSGIGTIGKAVIVDINTNNWNCSESVILIKPNKKLVVPKFLLYVLLSSNIQNNFTSNARGSTLKGIRHQDLCNTKIPLPPIEVQNEIVRILDSFTHFEAGLTAELTLRKKQYEYYRDLLLSFDSGIHCKTLGEVGIFYTGLSGKKKEDFTDGNEKFITYMNIFKNPSLNIDVEDKVKIYPSEKQNTIQYGDILITGSSETPEEAGFTSVLTTKTKEKLYLNSFSFGYRLNDLNLFNPEFLKFLFRSAYMRNQIRKTVNGVTRFNISKVKFEKILLPIIPLEKQNKIADILNKLYKLSGDMMNGLPKQIELLHKQYEYYRNKLLTFKELKD